MFKRGYFALGVILFVVAVGAVGMILMLTSAPESPSGEAFWSFSRLKFPRIPVRICGNGLVEAGEQCEPPNTATCNATCQKIVAACVDTDKSIDYGVLGIPSTASPDAQQKNPDLFVRGNATAPALATQYPQITGENPNKCGQRLLARSAGYIVFNDCCVDSNQSKMLTETFCKGTTGPYSIQIECANGCRDGACVQVLPTGYFNLAYVSPSYQAVLRGNSVSAAVGLASADGFSGIVSLAATCPAGATCTFEPSSSPSIPAGGSVNVNLAVSTLSSMPVGNYNITITASSAGVPSRSGTVKLSVYTNASQLCGNGEWDHTLGGYVAEYCDGSIISGTCTSYLGSSFTGDLSCTAGCKFNTSGCTYVPEPTQPGQPPTNTNLGEQKTLVILADFEESPIKNYTASDLPIAHEQIFVKMNDYITKTSYGKTWLSGTAVGPYKVGPGACDKQGLEAQRREMHRLAILAADPDVDLSQYSRIIILTDYPLCIPSSSGIANLQVQTQDGTITFLSSTDANFDWYVQLNSIGLVVHEFMHSFGLGHSGLLNCTDSSGQQTLLSNSCVFVGPWDAYTLMAMGGLEPATQLNSIERLQVGWLTNDQIQTVKSGTLQLLPLEKNTAGYKAIKVPVPNANFEYYIEFRQPGYETTVYPESVLVPFGEGGSLRQPNGVVIHIIDGTTSSSTPYILLDDLNIADSWSLKGVQIGRTYTDQFGSSIRVNDITNNVASITIGTAPGLTQCNDGINNDPALDEPSDRFKDNTDFSCIENGVYNPNHLSEFEPMAACQNHADDDGDGAVDLMDSGCSTRQDNSE